MVGAEGFEPPTLCSQSRCATRLRYAPTLFRLYRGSIPSWIGGKSASISLPTPLDEERAPDRNFLQLWISHAKNHRISTMGIAKTSPSPTAGRSRNAQSRQV